MTDTPSHAAPGDRATPVTVRPLDNGPLQVVDPDGTAYDLDGRQPVYLCRCGSSARRPFCDGSHAKVSFAAGERATKADLDQ